MDRIDVVERGRASYARRAWTDAYKSLVQAEEAGPLAGEDPELLATSAWMIGREDSMTRLLPAHPSDPARPVDSDLSHPITGAAEWTYRTSSLGSGSGMIATVT